MQDTDGIIGIPKFPKISLDLDAPDFVRSFPAQRLASSRSYEPWPWGHLGAPVVNSNKVARTTRTSLRISWECVDVLVFLRSFHEWGLKQSSNK